LGPESRRYGTGKYWFGLDQTGCHNGYIEQADMDSSIPFCNVGSHDRNHNVETPQEARMTGADTDLRASISVEEI
jgi:hypothetical protein